MGSTQEEAVLLWTPVPAGCGGWSGRLAEGRYLGDGCESSVCSELSVSVFSWGRRW